jgi:hypothetical protein
VSKSAKRICESQEIVFELNERSEFSEKGDLQLALGRVIPPPLPPLKRAGKSQLFLMVKSERMRTLVRQEAVFELNERSEFSEKGDLQLACKASTIAIIFLGEE